MRIHTDHNGVAVNAIAQTSDGTDVRGHMYQILCGPKTVTLEFQRGPVATAGVNGPTNEALLAILANRLRHLNTQFPCAENQRAINHIELAMEALEQRTRDRLARGVEGRSIE